MSKEEFTDPGPLLQKWFDELPENFKSRHQLQSHRFAAHLAGEVKKRIERYVEELPQLLESYNELAGLEGDNAVKTTDCPEGADPQSLLALCDSVMENHEKWTLQRLHRILGYIEGCMIATGMSTPTIERQANLEAKFSFSEGP